jgi:hypothetical protein
MVRPPYIAIGLLSACMLAYEVLLTRLFSILLWHHFAYMIISAAMLGYVARCLPSSEIKSHRIWGLCMSSVLRHWLC